MNGAELKVGDIFKYDGKIWKCKSNNGFMLSADNTDPTDNNSAIQWVGSIDRHEVEIITQ